MYRFSNDYKSNINDFRSNLDELLKLLQLQYIRIFLLQNYISETRSNSCMNTYECIFYVKSSPIEIKKKMNIKHFITNTYYLK